MNLHSEYRRRSDCSCCCPFLLHGERNNKRDYEEDSGGFGGVESQRPRNKRPRQWPLLISAPDAGVERERLIGGKGRSAEVWCDRRDKDLCGGCWEEDVLRGCRNRLEAGELGYV